MIAATLNSLLATLASDPAPAAGHSPASAASLFASVPSMTQKVGQILPEIALFLATCVVMVIGLSPSLTIRRFTAWVAGFGLLASLLLSLYAQPTGDGLLPNLMPYAKSVVAVVGLVLLLMMAGTVDRTEEALIASGRRPFEALRTNRAEFYAFFLFSLTGVMLCASASDLIWLFLALELVSLPTYIMVVMSRLGKPGARAQEAGVKYFFLGALGAATFLYGFTLIYGGTGHTRLTDIAASFSTHGLNSIALTGVLLSIVGIGFKIAAVPMHFYTADVYEGAASPISAFLAFAPKTAGFIAILLICSTVGWTHGPSGNSLPELVRVTLWVMAALTMTVGNVLALMQHSVKRMLAYSSIAHSGYMLVGVIAGPAAGSQTSGVSAVLFYLLCYGLMNAGCFAVIASLERKPASARPGEVEEPSEVENIEDLRGLRLSHPLLAWTMVLCALGLMGFPPLVGFFAKLPLFTSAISAGEIILVVVLGLNSAIAAYYYLRLVYNPLIADPDRRAETPRWSPFGTRALAGAVSAALVVLLVFFASTVLRSATNAAEVRAAGQVKPSNHATAGHATNHAASHSAPDAPARPAH